MSDGLIASFIERINANTLAYDNARAKRTESASAMFQEHPGDREDSGSAEEEEEEEVARKKSFKSLILKNLFSSKSGNDADDESEVTVEEDTCSDEDDKGREEEEEVEEDQDQEQEQEQEQERVPKEGDSKVTIGVEGPVTSRQPFASFLNQSSHRQILRGTKLAEVETNLYVSPIFGEDRVYLEHDEKGYVDIAIDGLTVSKTAGKGDFCGGAMLYPHLSEESARSHFLTLSQILINDGYRPNPKGNSSSESSNSNREHAKPEHASGEDSAEKEEEEVAPKKSTKSSTKSSKPGNDADEVTVEEDTCSETSDEDNKDREEEEEIEEDGYERVNKELASLLAQASSAQPLGVGNVASSLAFQPFATALNPLSSLQLLGGVKPAVSSLYLGPVYLENDKDDFVEIAINDGRMLSITSGKVSTSGNVSSCPHISEEKASIHFNETVQIYMNDGYRPKLKPENLAGSTVIQESSN